MKKQMYPQYKIEYQELSINPRIGAHHWCVVRDAVAHIVVLNTLHILTASDEHIMLSLPAVLRVNCERPPVSMEEWEIRISRAS